MVTNADANADTLKNWAKAAEALPLIAKTSMTATMEHVLHTRSMRQYAEGLRQYLSIRLGSVDLGDRALTKLRREVAEWPTETLITPPGPRAQIFRFARAIANSTIMSRTVATDRTLPWRELSHGIGTRYSSALAKIRQKVDATTAEVLELRFARALSVEEVAFVMGIEEAHVDACIADGRLIAQELVGNAPPSVVPGVDGALIEAFSLEPPQTAENGTISATGGGLATGETLAERYRIEERVGVGAFGDVYRASDTDVPGHVVALKLLHQPALSEVAKAVALRELRHIASVFHPSVVQFKDHGWHEGRLWFVMPWYSGETLEKRIKRSALTRPEARQIFEPLAQGLAAIHSAGVRHQDIKPDNIFLARLNPRDPESEILPVLIDLGVAALDSEMVFAGTPQYFAPEIAAQFGERGPKRAITNSADVFSIALALRNALEPQTAEEVTTADFEAFVDHRAAHPPKPPEGAQLRYLAPYFRRWLSLDPRVRPSIDQFANELAILTAPEERRTRRNRTLRWLIPSILAIATGFGAVVYVMGKNTELQTLRAARAQNEVSVVRADLKIAGARQQALQEDLSAAQASIESSQLTRAELATQLAQKEEQIRITREDLVKADKLEKQLHTDIADMTARNVALDAELASTHTQLTLEQERANRLGNDLTHTQSELAQREQALSQTRTDNATLSNELGASRLRATQLATENENRRAQIAANETRMHDLERRISESETERARLEISSGELRRDVARLERELSAARTPAPAPTLPTPTN